MAVPRFLSRWTFIGNSGGHCGAGTVRAHIPAELARRRGRGGVQRIGGGPAEGWRRRGSECHAMESVVGGGAGGGVRVVDGNERSRSR